MCVNDTLPSIDNLHYTIKMSQDMQTKVQTQHENVNWKGMGTSATTHGKGVINKHGAKS